MVVSGQQAFLELEAEEKKRVHLLLAAKALNVWRSYISKKKRLRYRDSVTGMKHNVDVKLPERAMNSVLKKELSSAEEGDELGADITRSYLEPITALQDFDWRLPDQVLYGYYAIYNLFQKYCEAEELDDWLIVNQCLSSLGPEADLKLELDRIISYCVENDEIPIEKLGIDKK